jgi:molybdopterin-containing oxidoreductase family iron-sulfur binding subunit
MADSSNGMNRRRFLKVLGVTGGGTAAMSACSSDKVEKLIPYLVPPDNQIPGIATWYASTCGECSAGCGVHVRVREGRAVKVEGNPDHPVNAGKLCARGQASMQGLYNPDRVREPMARNADGSFAPITWDDALDRITTKLGETAGERIRFMTGHEAGSFDRLVDEWLRAFGSAGRVRVEPQGYEALRHASRAVFGIDATPRYAVSGARYVLSFGTDFLETFGSPVRQAADFAASHGFRDGAMGRYVHVEPRMSMTGMSADEWIAPVPGSESLVALAMTHVVATEGLGRPPRDVERVSALVREYTPESVAGRTGIPAETITRLAREFAAESSVALAGGLGGQHAAAHATAAASLLLNYVTGNIGTTVLYDRDQPSGPSTYADLTALVEEMRGGGVEVLFVHGANPAYGTPTALGMADAMAAVPFTVSFARFMDETAQRADLILPDLDPLEQWNDVVPHAGMRGLRQPSMQPVFGDGTRQTGDVLLAIAAAAGGSAAGALSAASFKDYLQTQWRAVHRAAGDRGAFEAFWTASLQRGGYFGQTVQRPVSLIRSLSASDIDATWVADAGAMVLMAYPSPALYDGRGANRPWLQELPDPVTKVTWGSWVEVNPETAAEHGIHEGDIVEITTTTGSVRVPAYLYPGVRKDTLAVPMGQGHTAFGRYAEGRGINVMAVLAPEPTAYGGIGTYASAAMRHTGEHVFLAKTEGKPRQLDRGIAQAVTLAALQHGEHDDHHGEHAAPVPEHIEEVLDQWQERQDEATKYGNYEGEHPRWALAIDLSRCTGCTARSDGWRRLTSRRSSPARSSARSSWAMKVSERRG